MKLSDKDNIFEKHEIRKSNKQKMKFIEYVYERLEKVGYTKEDISVDERWIGLLRTRNIVVGNPDKAKFIVGAHYDTCAISPFPNFMFPTNPIMYILSQCVVMFLALFIAWWVMVPFALYVENPNACIYAFQFTLIAILIQLAFGFRNKHTANDNTSGVITLFKILEKIPEEKRKQICVVFFDNEEKGLWGSLYFAKKYPKSQNKILLNIDCVGDGNNLLFMAKRGARQNKYYEYILNAFQETQSENSIKFFHKKMKPLMFPSDQANFDCGVGICTLKKGLFGMYAGRIHTPFDTKCDMKNIEYVSDAVLQAVLSLPQKSKKIERQEEI